MRVQLKHTQRQRCRRDASAAHASSLDRDRSGDRPLIGGRGIMQMVDELRAAASGPKSPDSYQERAAVTRPCTRVAVTGDMPPTPGRVLRGPRPLTRIDSSSWVPPSRTRLTGLSGCRPRSTGVGTARRHLVGAQVGPVGEVGMPAVRHSAGHREIDQHHVEQTNHHRDHPANPSRGAMVGVAAHHRGAAGEFDQWKYRKRNTERQHHL